MQMGTIWKDMMIAAFMGFFLPSIVVNTGILIHEAKHPEMMEEAPVALDYGDISVVLRSGEILYEANLERYLVGVVCGEMPASFEPEALKAQAVAARTYTAKAAVTGGKHGNGSLCTDSTCCQAYLSEIAFYARGGTPEDLEKIRTAVLETKGQVLTYGDELIEATYFSCSGGYTEDAAEVWGTEYPYLVSVASPGEENAAWYRDTVQFTQEELSAALELELTGDPKDWVESAIYTAAGSVESITICGETFTGTNLRSLLGLRSAAFSVETTDGMIQITTRGYGHRVGLSQYGADAMALEGCTYPEILAHYYPGTTLARMTIDEGGAIVYH